MLALGNNMDDSENDGLGLARALVYLVPVSLGFWLGMLWYALT